MMVRRTVMDRVLDNLSIWYDRRRIKGCIKHKKVKQLLKLRQTEHCSEKEWLTALGKIETPESLDMLVQQLFPMEGSHNSSRHAVYRVLSGKGQRDGVCRSILAIGRREGSGVGERLKAVLAQGDDEAFQLSATMLMQLDEPGLPELLRKRLIAPAHVRLWVRSLLHVLDHQDRQLDAVIRGELADYARLVAKRDIDHSAARAHAEAFVAATGLRDYTGELKKYLCFESGSETEQEHWINLLRLQYTKGIELTRKEQDEIIQTLSTLDGEHWMTVFGTGAWQGNRAAMAEYEQLLPKDLIIKVYNASTQAERAAIAEAFLSAQSDLRRIHQLSYVSGYHVDGVSHEDGKSDPHTDEQYYDDGGYRRGYWTHEDSHTDCDAHNDYLTEQVYQPLTESGFDF